MNQPATASTEAIIAHPLFLELTRVRARLRWSCAAVVVALFIAFMLAVSNYKSLLATRVGTEVVPLGFMSAIAMGVVALVVTGIYVRQANHRFTTLTERLKLAVRQ